MSRAAAPAQVQAKAVAGVMRAAAPVVRRRERAGFAPAPLASLSAVPARAVVQRKCAGCEEETSKVWPRLAVGPVGDTHEVEADAIAGRVMAMRDGDVSAADSGVQRACSKCDDRVMRAGGDDGGETIGVSDGELTSGGRALSGGTRDFFEARMGRDLSDVRVHEGAGSARLNASIAARAFTYRNHVWLGAGEREGPSFTMAHELAHVMQQTEPGPVGGDAVQRAPFFMPGDRLKPTNAVMHEVAQGATRNHNADLITEVPIPGANRKVVQLGKCGFADFYTATPRAALIPVPGLEEKDVGGVKTVGTFDEIASKASCVFSGVFGTAKRGKGGYDLGPARGPLLNTKGEVEDVGKAPMGIKVGELKPAHDVNYRGSGVTQLNNYIAGIDSAKSVTNDALKAQGSSESWNPGAVKWTDITLPPGWDAKGVTAATTWPVKNLKIRDYSTPPPSISAKPKKKKGSPAAPGGTDVVSGALVQVSGRWMMAKDSTRIPGGDGVYVYFLAPNPSDLTRALKSRRTTVVFKKLAAKLRAIYKPLVTPPKVKKGVRKRPLAGPVPVPMRRPKVRRRAVDAFAGAGRVHWELLRTGAFEEQRSSGSLAEYFATNVPDVLREDMAQMNGVADWVRNPPEKADKLVYDKTGAQESDPAATDFDTMRKAAFWASPLARPIGILRERFGQMFIQGHAAFVKVRKKIKALFGGAQFSSGVGGSIGKKAVFVIGKVFAKLGKIVLKRTAEVIVRCLQSGFVAFMEKQIAGSVDELVEKAVTAEADAEKLKDDIEAKIEAMLDTALGDYEQTIRDIADDAKVITAITGAIAEITRIARLVFCLSGLGAAGWGAIVTCLLSVADYIASKFDKSPLDAIIEKVMGSCIGQEIFAKALMGFQTVRELPTTLAKIILRPLKDNLPAPANEMICDIDSIKVPDLGEADFKCGKGGGETDDDDDDDTGSGGGGSGSVGNQTGHGGGGAPKGSGGGDKGTGGPGGGGTGEGSPAPQGGAADGGAGEKDKSPGGGEPADTIVEGKHVGDRKGRVNLYIVGGFSPTKVYDQGVAEPVQIFVHTNGRDYGPAPIKIFVHAVRAVEKGWDVDFRFALKDPTADVMIKDAVSGMVLVLYNKAEGTMTGKIISAASQTLPANREPAK